jgi:peptidoglycan hydrolase FlgJ
MIDRAAAASATAGARQALSPHELRLRDAAAQMEGVFMTHLLRALRETKPEGGIIDGGAGEEMFTGMLDEHVARISASRSENGLGAALFRQLRARLAAAGSGEAVPSTFGPATRP